MTKTETYGEIKDGELHIVRRKDFIQSLKSMPNCRVIVTVAKAYKKRSNPQNAYLHGVVVNDFMTGFKETTGEDIKHDDAFEILKFYCNYKEVPNELTGEIMKVPLTSTTLSTTQFEEMLDRMRAFIFEWFGITTMLPNEQSELIFNKEED